MKIIFFIVFGCVLFSCIYGPRPPEKPVDERIQDNAKHDFNVESAIKFREKVAQEAKALEEKKQNFFGLRRIQTGCAKTETNLVSEVLSSAIAQPNRREDNNDHTYCAKYNYSNWLRLNWACGDESTSFIKTKTLRVLNKPGGLIFMLNDEGEILQSLPIKIDQNCISMDSVSDEVYAKVKRLKVALNKDIIVVEKSDLAKTILLSEKICQPP